MTLIRTNLYTSYEDIEKSTFATFSRNIEAETAREESEFDLFQFRNAARKRLNKLGIKNAKLIEAMGALSGIASMLQMKMELSPDKINHSTYQAFESDLRNLIQKVEDLEANYLT